MMNGPSLDDPVVRVLLVDDLPEVRNIIRKLLPANDAGVKFQIVRECGDGAEGIRLFQQLHPDVVLTNAQMPVVGGLEMAEKILGHDPGARIRFLTASNLDSRLPRAVEIGARGWICKPPSSDQLVAALKQLVEQPAERESFFSPSGSGRNEWVEINKIDQWLAPYLRAEADGQPPPDSSRSIPEEEELGQVKQAPNPTHRARVLVVDDILETRRRLIGYILREPRLVAVGEAGNGDEAVEKFRRLSPDVVSMNVNMPGIDGIAATKIMCSTPGGARVVIVSVVFEPDYIERAFAAGAMRFLSKPVNRADYVHALIEVANDVPRRPSMA